MKSVPCWSFPKEFACQGSLPFGGFLICTAFMGPPQCRVSGRSKSNTDFLLRLRKLFVKPTTVSGFC